MQLAVGAFFLRVGESSHALKSGFLHEVYQLVEVFLRFTGKSHHQRSPDGDTRHAPSDFFQQGDGLLARHVAQHGFQHVVGDMLQGYIQVFADVVVPVHHVEKFQRELVGIGIMKSDPFHALDVGNTLNEVSDMMLSVEVHAVIGQFLLDHLEFLHALAHEISHFLQDFLLGAAMMTASD